MNSLRCLKGVLLTPFIIGTNNGNYDVQKETFYTINTLYYFLIDTSIYPWKIVRGIKVR